MAIKNKKEIASEQFVIRFTQREKKKFEALAQKAGLSLSEYARQSIFSKREKDALVDVDLLMELRHAAGLCKSALCEKDSASVTSAFLTLQDAASKIVRGI